MEEDTEYLKLPLEDRCVHKLWKARLNGYEEAVKLFNKIDDEKSPEWNKFLGLIKKFVADSNAVAQEKGLEATLAFVENCGNAGKTAGDVVSGIVGKCIAAPKTRTRELSLQIILMYVEIEKQEAVQDELVKGMDHKNPKIVSACVAAVTQGLREFGPKVITIKPLVKKMPSLLEDRDKTVREEGKAMIIEMHRWIRDALKPQLASLKPLQVAELETEFEKSKNEKVLPTRYLRSQQARQAKAAAEACGSEEDEGDGSDEGAVEIDPYELMVPVDILSKLPSGFYEKMEAKKWQERKEAVDAVEALLQSSPRLESGDYGDLIRAIKKVITKDSNVVVVSVAIKCLAGLANGLKKRFQPYAGACIPALLEKFREKKASVVSAIREAVDAVYQSTSLENIQEDVLAALDNKNPSVKAETAAFLARCFTKCTPIMLSKKLLKAYSTALIKALNEPDPSVRDNAAEALGTALKVVGEKVLMPFLSDVDNLKMTKITECCEKAIIVAKPSKSAPSERPSTAPAKAARGEQGSTGQAGSTAPKPVKRPTTSAGPSRKPSASSTASAGSSRKSTAQGKAPKDVKYSVEKDMTPEEVDEKAAAILPAKVISALADSVWKNRLAAVEEFSQVVMGMDSNDAASQVLVRTLQKKPGLKDTNFQVLKAKLEVLKMIADNFTLSTTSVSYILNDVTEKLGDVKNGASAAETLTSLAEATKLDFVASEVLDFALNNQKSPKVQQEALNWLSQALLEFGFVAQPKPLIENVKKAVSATNPTVRTAAIQLVGTLHLFMGPQLSLLFENEKPATVQQIHAEFEKKAGQKPPAPVRGLSKASDSGVGDEEENESCQEPSNAQDYTSQPGSRSEKVRGNLQAKSAQTKARGIVPSQSDDQLAGKAGGKTSLNAGGKASTNISSGTKTITKSKPGTGSKPSSRKKDEDVDASPLVQVNNLKNQRSIDEQKLKVLKWNFNSPRDEFVELLRDQMTAACFNRNLIANMFHSDFKFHLKAIDMLTEDLSDNGKALMCNLDLILKWMTLRFFDTNPSVLLKGLEYLQTVFNMLIADNYSMLETEASSFIPYLILKVGDPKDAVRHSVRGLFEQISHVYSVSRLFTYVMDGLKSKNARQRTECLEELGGLIENNGTSVCQPSAAAALKEIAKQISDRDNAVRNAALNCVVQVYYLEGEKVYKMVGNISDKDMSLLEERIKRAAKNRPVARVPPTNAVRPSIATAPVSSQQVVAQQSPPRQPQDSNDEEELEESPQDEVAASSPPLLSKARPASGPFGLDMEFIEKIETERPVSQNPKLIKIDLSEINQPSGNSKVNLNRETKSIVNALNAHNSPRMNPLPDVLKDFTLPKLHQQQSRDSVEDILDRTMNLIAGSDLSKCSETLTQIDYLIRSDKMKLIVPRVDQFISCCIAQLRTLVLCSSVYSKEEQTMVLRALFAALHSFYTQPTLSRQVSVGGLKDTILVMVRMLAEKRLDGLSDIDNFVQVVNILVMVIIDKSEHSQVTCALLKLLYESVEKGDQWPAKMQELIMKCIWKVVRSFPSWEPDVDYDSIMYEIHIFLKAFPTRMWKQSHSDVPLRTVKTLLHAMVKQRGSKVLSHMNRISDPDESELPIYINKFIKTVKQDDQKAKEEKISQQRLSKDTHEVLAEIFKKIGSKDHTKEGLRLLYEFKEQHADASIEPFLRKSSQFFQEYIQRGLQTIECDRRREAAMGATGSGSGSNPASVRPAVTTLTSNSSNATDNEEMRDAKYYTERLRTLLMNPGHEPTGPTPPSENKDIPFNLDTQLGFDQNLNLNSEPENPNQLTGGANRSEVSNKEALRRRLEGIIGSSR